jgi:hypothetical protein
MAVLAARSNQIEDLEPIIPAALAALRNIHPGRDSGWGKMSP